MSTKHVVILGGGPSGLYAARVLSLKGMKVTILDKGKNPGGLACGHQFNQNWYDTGVHMFHAHEKEIFEDIKKLMASERIEVPLNAKIKWSGNFYRYPLQFQDMIKGIPFFTLTKQVIGLFAAQLSNYFSPKEPHNAEEALIQLYGNPLYEFFFRDFTHRYWGIHPRELSATFITTKMPRLSAVDVIKRALAKVGVRDKTKAVDSALREEILSYSITGTETLPRSIVKGIQEKNGTVIQEAEVIKVITENNKITQIVYLKNNQEQVISCDECISTIPINRLIDAITPSAPSEVLNSAKMLKYKPISVYGLLVKKQKCIDSLYIYYRDRIFHRVGEPKNAGLIVTPAHYTTLIVETTCEINDAKWNGEDSVKKKMLEDLALEDICLPEEVVEIHQIKSETGYPIFALGFEPFLETVKKYLKSFDNFQTIGRQGNFCYPNMHTAMRMGADAANKIILKHQSDITEKVEQKDAELALA